MRKGISIGVIATGVFFALCVSVWAETSAEPVWFDEFAVDGRPNPERWTFETGFVRNRELQEYRPENAYCSNGWLVIEAREGANRLTSASVITKGLRSFGYGRLEVCAKIETKGRLWPAIWLLGDNFKGDQVNGGRDWPACGEIDVLEYYNDSLHANFCWGDNGNGWGALDRVPAERAQAKWNSTVRPMRLFRSADSAWADRWHVWSLERTPEVCSISLDGKLLNLQTQDTAVNPKWCERSHPFREPMYLLLNLALKDHEFDASERVTYPARMLVDYVRFYKYEGKE